MRRSSMKLLLKRLHVWYFCGLSERSLFKMFSFKENVSVLVVWLFLSCMFLVLNTKVCHHIAKYLAVGAVVMKLARFYRRVTQIMILVVNLQMGIFLP